MRVRSWIAAGLLLLPAAAVASETATYSYDAKGRLTAVLRSGGPNNGVAASYTFDAADNRTNVVTTGAFYNGSAQTVVVVPLHGGQPIVISTN